ncbi:MAG: DNA replication/repair protein RecF [Pseudohongiellaceae bacterium]
MSVIRELQITGVRNLQQVELQSHPHFNLIHGANGSGKTSLLEAIHLLGLGRSFRTAQTDSLINHERDEAVVFVRLSDNHKLGISRGRRDRQRLKLDDQVQSNWDRVAALLPILVLDANAFLLLEGGPGSRRQFMDWGVFHVEPDFLAQWRRTRKCLANRNQLLKGSRPDRQQLKVWDRELCAAAELVDKARNRYLDALLPEFARVYQALVPDAPFALALEYHRGWPAGESLLQVLEDHHAQDVRYRATQFGPQRADLAIRAGKQKAVEVLSRGQQKMLVIALKIAQGRLLSLSQERLCCYLVDDLPAELDADNRAAVMRYLVEQESQLFVTSVSREAVLEGLDKATEMAAFHVERGKIRSG